MSLIMHFVSSMKGTLNSRQSRCNSDCEIHLPSAQLICGDVASMDIKPRPDLLELWIKHLHRHNAEWEIDWACASPNKEKCLWIALKGVEGKINKTMVDVARQELQKMGHRNVGGFVLALSGTVVVNMASLRIAQDLRNKKSVKISKLSKQLLLID